MPQIFANNATSTLSAAATLSDTSIFVQPAHGSRFPIVTAPDFCYCTLENAAGAIEIVKVTAHTSGASALTVVRAQQGTTARAWAIGDLFDLRLTAAEAAAWEADIDSLVASLAGKADTTGETYTGTHDFSGGIVSVPTPTNNAHAVNMAYVLGLAFSSTLPGQSANAGKFVTTDGTSASWADALTPTGTQTVTNKTISFANNTVAMTKAQLNAAVSDADVATLDGSESLTNKTLDKARVLDKTLSVSTNTTGVVSTWYRITAVLDFTLPSGAADGDWVGLINEGGDTTSNLLGGDALIGGLTSRVIDIDRIPFVARKIAGAWVLTY